MTSFTKKLFLTLDMIKFQHSIFALPFALTSLFFATQGRPSLRQFILIVLCMVTARNAAMSFNRIVDRDIDRANPRTQNRPIPRGELSLRFSIGFCVFNALLFIFITGFFNHLTFLLSPLALAIVLAYSLTKRFTHATQFFLGLALGVSPLATWIAVTGTLTVFPILLGVGVFFWVAGFDLIYSCQDVAFDRQHGLKNLVVRLGINNALLLAKILHALCVVSFILAGRSLGLGASYFAGIIFITMVLIYEHTLVRPNDLSRVNVAFFTLNGYVSLSFFGFSLLQIYWK